LLRNSIPNGFSVAELNADCINSYNVDKERSVTVMAPHKYRMATLGAAQGDREPTLPLEPTMPVEPTIPADDGSDILFDSGSDGEYHM